MAQGFELRQSDSSSHPIPQPPVNPGDPEVLGGLRGPRRAPTAAGRGSQMETHWVGTALGGGASPMKPSPPPACLPSARSPGQEARGPWPDSRTGGGEVSGATHQREKLLGNSGWPPGSVTLRVSRPRASRALYSPSGPRSPYPQDPPTWTKLGGSWG